MANGRQMKKLMFAQSWMGGAPMPTAWGLKGDYESWGVGPSHNWWQFSSEHQGAVMFAFADGSVKVVGYNISSQVLIDLSGIADGVAVTDPAVF